jgi:fructokinase
MNVRVGVDLGGTKIEAAALDDNGEIVARRRVTTPAGDYSATVGAIVELVEVIEADYDEQGSVGAGGGSPPSRRQRADHRGDRGTSTRGR